MDRPAELTPKSVSSANVTFWHTSVNHCIESAPYEINGCDWPNPKFMVFYLNGRGAEASARTNKNMSSTDLSGSQARQGVLCPAINQGLCTLYTLRKGNPTSVHEIPTLTLTTTISWGVMCCNFPFLNNGLLCIDRPVLQEVYKFCVPNSDFYNQLVVWSIKCKKIAKKRWLVFLKVQGGILKCLVLSTT